jgi:hypothetical protein
VFLVAVGVSRHRVHVSVSLCSLPPLFGLFFLV